MQLARVGCWVACAVALAAGGWSVPPRDATLAVPPRAGTATASPVAGYTLANAALTIGVATDCGGVPIDLINRADDHALAGVRAYEPVEHLVTAHPRTRERRLWVGTTDAQKPLAWSVGYELAADAALLLAECQISNTSTQTVQAAGVHPFLNGCDLVSALPLVDARPTKPVLHPAFIVRGWEGTVPTNLTLAAGATRTFTRWWYPVLGLGGLKTATRFAAVNFFATGTPGELFLGIHVPVAQANCTIEVKAKGEVLFTQANVALTPARPWCQTLALPAEVAEKSVRVAVRAADGTVLVDTSSTTTASAPAGAPGSVRELLVKAFRLRQRGEAAAASKTLRAVTAIAPLDPVAAAERIFLEDDGEDAVATLVKTRGLTAASFRRVRDFYRDLKATREFNEWVRQGRSLDNQKE